MVVKRGDKGPNVKLIQKALSKHGFWPYNFFTENFYSLTESQVKSFQKANGLVDDGIVGGKTIKLLKVALGDISDSSDHKYKGVIIIGANFPAPIKSNLKIRFSQELTEEYLPEMNSVMSDRPLGFKLLITIMAHKEGFRRGTRSYRTNNPGNIGNTDAGVNLKNLTLKDGINLQKNYILKVASGKHRAYPLGKIVNLNPYFSPEIARNSKLYGMSPHLPGYTFMYTGRLDQFVKIYATGARAGNGYLSMIISYFRKNGIVIDESSAIQDIIKINK